MRFFLNKHNFKHIQILWNSMKENITVASKKTHLLVQYTAGKHTQRRMTQNMESGDINSNMLSRLNRVVPSERHVASAK